MPGLQVHYSNDDSSSGDEESVDNFDKESIDVLTKRVLAISMSPSHNLTVQILSSK